ncbi:MAG TPA: hypothetical protein VEB21_06140, partial [Terriglobales bacterium]|nr:hypothetical protein [Terriglobales bacterium]
MVRFGGIARRVTTTVVLLFALLADVILTWPLLRETSLAPHQTRRAYYEPGAKGTGVVIRLDEQRGGYMTDVGIAADGALEVPGGRTIGIPLERNTVVTVRSLAADLAPYIVVGLEVAPAADARAGELASPLAMAPAASGVEMQPWNATAAWAEDKRRLQALRQHCSQSDRLEAVLEHSGGIVRIRLGSCSVEAALGPGQPMLLLVTGQDSAVAHTSAGWRTDTAVRWPLLATVLVRLLLLAAAIGAAPAALVEGILLALAGSFSLHAALLVWVVSTPLALAGAAARLASLRWPQRPLFAAMCGLVALAMQVAAVLLAVSFLDIGTFGHERIEHRGDGACSLVGYSTVRGDSLRHGSPGVLEQLDAHCPGCNGRSSRFSREAQTLGWIRQVLCDPAFPPAAGAEIVFIGGGNDDLFYRPGGLLPRLLELAAMIRFAAQPFGPLEWRAGFDLAHQRAPGAMAAQARDIEAIAACARARGHRFRFLHDFLVWDLDGGRPAVRQQTMAHRRRAAEAAGADFVDLYEAFGASA